MNKILLCLALAAALVPLLGHPAHAMTQDEAVTLCRAQLGSTGQRDADARQKFAACVRAQTKKK
jgi:hypothetical protein